MYDREKFLKALENKGYKARYFATGKEAADYVCSQVKGCTVGFGGSATIEELDLVDRLAENNTCFCPEMKYRPKELTFNEAALDTLRTDVFLLSVNGAAEDGTLVNIDGTGNRVGSSLFGHKKVFFVFSENKIMPTVEQAVERARNVASPRNAAFLECKTPCAAKGDKCYDCSSPDRICNAMVIYMHAMEGTEMEVVLTGETLGY